jgi:hypothetical protein
MQPSELFRILWEFAGDFDAAAAEMRKRAVRAAARTTDGGPSAVPAASPAGGGSSSSAAGCAGAPSSTPVWMRELEQRHKLAGQQAQQQQPSALRQKDKLNDQIRAHAALGAREACQMLTDRGAKQRLADEGISARQSVPAVQARHRAGTFCWRTCSLLP